MAGASRKLADHEELWLININELDWPNCSPGIEMNDQQMERENVLSHVISSLIELNIGL